MVLPIIYRGQGSNVISSFDWYDAGLGAGYKAFYAGACTNNAATTYFLTTKTIKGDFPIRYVGINNTNVELNFDMPFNNPMTVKGEALINYTLSSDVNVSQYCKFTFYKVNLASAETSIGTITTSTLNTGGASEHRRLAKISLTQTSFAIGEKLRVEVIFYSGGAGNSTLWFDPSSRQTRTESGSGATIGTDIEVDIPFMIDL